MHINLLVLWPANIGHVLICLMILRMDGLIVWKNQLRLPLLIVLFLEVVPLKEQWSCNFLRTKEGLMIKDHELIH